MERSAYLSDVGTEMEHSQFMAMLRKANPHDRALFFDSMREALKTPIPKDQEDPSLRARVLKSSSNIVGLQTALQLTANNLQSPALNAMVNVSPVLKTLPRRVYGGTGFKFKIIKDVDIGANFNYGFVAEPTLFTAGGTEGRTTPPITASLDDVTFNWSTFGCENAESWQARIGGVGFNENFQPDEVMRASLLYAANQRQELMNLFSNAVALGTPGTPNITGITQLASGTGSLSVSTQYFFKVSAITGLGYRRGATGRTGGVDALGESLPSAEFARTTAASGVGSDSIAMTWPAVAGAVGYNVYGSATTGTEVYLCTVFCNRVNILKITSSSSNTVNVADKSADPNGFAGIYEQISKSSTSYRINLAGASLTNDGTGAIGEINTMLKDRKRTKFLGMGDGANAWMGIDVKDMVDTTAIQSSTPVYRYDVQPGGSVGLTVGNSVAQQINRFDNNRALNFRQHDLFPPGMIFGWSENLGDNYPLLQLPSTVEMALGAEVQSWEFAINGLFWPAAVYGIGAPVVRLPFATYAIFGIGPITNYNG